MAHPHNKITEEELLQELQRVADRVELPVTTKDMRDVGNYSSTPYLNRWGSWTKALIEAGVEVTEKQRTLSDSITKISKSKVLAELREIYKKHGKVTKELVDEDADISSTTIQYKFESFNSALKTAMLPITHEKNTAQEFDCDGCGETLTRQPYQIKDKDYFFCSYECMHNSKVVDVQCENCGDEIVVPVTTDTSQNNFCDSRCRNQFYKNNPPNAVKVSCDNCGDRMVRSLSFTEKGAHNFCSQDCSHDYHTLDRSELLKDFERIAEILDRTPSTEDVREHSKHGLESYYKYFDGLCDVAKRLRLEPNEHEPVHLECHNCGQKFQRNYTQATSSEKSFCERDCFVQWMRSVGFGNSNSGQRPQYGPSWPEQRKKARQRDQYQCQRCGMSVEEHIDEYGMTLHVHHIDPWYEFENHQERNSLSNLVTLCVSCHGKYGSLPVRPQVIE